MRMVFHAHMKPHITSSTATKTTAPTASLHRIQKFNDTSAVFIWIMLQILWSYSLQMFPESIRVGPTSVFWKTLGCKHTLIEFVCNCACSKSDCVMGRLNSSFWELLFQKKFWMKDWFATVNQRVNRLNIWSHLCWKQFVFKNNLND